MKENSIEETIKQLKLMLKVRKEQKEIIECAGGSCINCDPDIKALSESIHILSDYKRVLKENEELLQEKINNQKIIALAQNNMLNYQAGFEDGKNGRTSAVQSIIENRQYYIFQKQIEKYERHIEKLQKENEELNKHVIHLTDEQYKTVIENAQNDINQKWIQKVKDKIEELKQEKKKYGNCLIEMYEDELVNRDIKILQELLEGRK